MPKYLVKTGLEFPPDRRVEAGEVTEDIPAKSIKWLREQGFIELLDATTEKTEKYVTELKKPVAKSKGDE